MSTGNTNYTRLITATLQNHVNEIVDGVSTNIPLTNILKESGNIKMVAGGRKFTHALRYKKNNTFASIAKLDPIPLTNQNNISRAEYDPKVLAGSLVIPTFDMACNAGNKEKLIDLAMEVKEDAIISMTELLGVQVFAAGTGNDFGGLQNLISTAPESQTDVGGIDPSATGNEFWRNYVYGTAVTAFNTDNAGVKCFDAMLNGSTFGRQGPRVVITTKAIWSLYSLAMVAQIQYASKTGQMTGDKAFNYLSYATMPVYFDDNCPAGKAYMVDTDSMKLQVLSQANFKVTEFQQSHGQLSETALMYLFANLTTGSRRTNAISSAITA